jgi:hypothetical protein
MRRLLPTVMTMFVLLRPDSAAFGAGMEASFSAGNIRAGRRRPWSRGCVGPMGGNRDGDSRAGADLHRKQVRTHRRSVASTMVST